MSIVTIFTSSYNDEIMLPHNLSWYKKRFNNPRIVVLDNKSTDSSVEIAKSFGCESVVFDSYGKVPIEMGQWIKNNTWKRAETDWVIFVDCDEFLDMNEQQLQEEHDEGATLIKTCGWDVVNLKNDLDIDSMKWGKKNYFFDKIVCFKKSEITEINYDIGAHQIDPEGRIQFSNNTYNLLHKHYVNIDYVFNKYNRNQERLSEEQKKKKWGSHYSKNKNDIAREFDKLKKFGQKI